MKPAHLVPEGVLPRLDPLPDLWPGREVVVDGATTFVREIDGRGDVTEPALYVHGLGGSSSNWTDLGDLLADRLAGQAIDLPGFGRSEPAASYTVPAMARRITRWIETSGRGPVHLFANSMGGAAAVLVAADRPDLIRTLTLISPAMPFLDPRRSTEGRLVPLLLLPHASRIAAQRFAAIEPADLIRMVIGACFADPTRFPEQRMAHAIEEAKLRHTLPWYGDAYTRSLRGLVTSFLRAYLPGAGSLWRAARRISVPTLVIAGTRDRLVDVRVGPQVARVIPDSRLLMIDGVGHVPQMEAPIQVARAVLGLLDECAGTARGATQPTVAAPGRAAGVAGR
ncbi:MAG TPA: alpha/beta hydrolase [Micromonosporaceae bacterium]|nr:alpha/beta hydrolase [Micromonosporaceae bacterium]